jgi:alpha-amylase/alpha-mannosidase (GH57 family)
MHQPFYKDLLSGEYRLPWTRLHALKDYYGMVKILEEFPHIRQTFNLVPSMMVQVEEYASGAARDPFLEVALKPAEQLTSDEQRFLLRHFFHANPGRMIYRYPRYGELYDAWIAQNQSRHAQGLFGPQELRDLQVLSQLAWFDEDFQENDPVISTLIRKGRHYSIDEQQVVGKKERELIGLVIPAYKALAKKGQIEISTTPFYHPILPLLCDSNIASVSHPGVPLPRRFRYPEDARRQLEMGREYIQNAFGVAPVGLWPSEGSVSDETFAIAAKAGFRWAATDNGVLDRTLGQGAGVDSTYRPWVWSQSGHEMKVIFRDHLMSDLIGFVYSGMYARDAANDFLHRIRQNCRGILASGRDAMVPIILDGENAWEYYDRNGRPFFRELYTQIQADSNMESVTVAEALNRIEPVRLDRIFPGSWINANFDVWIGAEEDNRAWEFLLDAREAYENSPKVLPEKRQLAYEELLIAEGSDWCWWYGPEHDSANREDFDALFRSHIANVYRALNLTPPQELSRPILRVDVPEEHFAPTGPIQAVVDGTVNSYFEWLGAGVYHVSSRGGAMHGKRFVVRELYYGSDGAKLFLRFDFAESAQDLLSGLDVLITTRALEANKENQYSIRVEGGSAHVVPPTTGAHCAFLNILEAEFDVPPTTDDIQFQVSFWHDGLPVDAIPAQGWLTVNVAELVDWAV